MDSTVFLKMEYFELPDGSTSFLHQLKDRNTLWEINNKPEMYEVEILQENYEDFDKNIDDLINMNKIHCSICNLDVPKIYQKEHNKTSIHQNLLSLTDEVLERTKKHLKTDDEPTSASLNVTDTFFCETCSKIIQNDNRIEHLESKYHRKHEIFDKLLNFFIEAYLRVNEDTEVELEDVNDFIESVESSLLKHSSETIVSKLPSDVSKDPSQIQNQCETTISKLPLDVSKDPSQSQNQYETKKENLSALQISMESSKSEHSGQNLVPKDTKSEHSDHQTNLNQINPNFNPMNPNFNPMNAYFNPMNPNFHPNFNNMNPFWNPVNPNFNFMYPMHGNWNPMNPYLNAMNPVNPNTNLNPMNPYFNAMNPNINPMDPQYKMHPNTNPINPMNPNPNHMNPNQNQINPNFSPMNPNPNPMNPNQNQINPNFNPMNPDSNPMNPNQNQINPNFNPMNPNPNPMNPNQNQINPNFNSMNPNLNQINPNFNPMNPNLNEINPNSNPNLHPMDPQHKLGPNLNPIDSKNKLNSNSKPIELQTKYKVDSKISWIPMVPPSKYKLNSNITLIPNVPQSKSDSNSNLNTLDPRSQSDSNSNLNTPDPQSKSDSNSNLNTLDSLSKSDSNSNLNTPDPKFELGPDLYTYLTPIPAETKKQDIISERKRLKLIKNIQAFEEFSSYIKHIQDKYPKPGFKIEAVTKRKIKVTALNGDCVVVKKKDFQSNDGKYCRVCQNINLDKNHEMSEEHISRIMVPVADKNCIREIDDIWSHCILCNQLIKFVDEHNKTTRHLTILNKCFIDTPKKTEENEPKSIVSEGIKEKELNEQEKKEKRVDTQEKKAPFKIDIDKFSNTLADKLLPLFAKHTLTKDDDTESNDNHNGSLESEKKETIEVAKETNKVKELKQSILNVDELYKSLTDDPKTDEASNGKDTVKYCSVCRIHVANFETHKTSNSHAENTNRKKELRKIISRNNMKETKDRVDILKCYLCKIDVNYHSKDIDDHVNSQNHKRNYFKFIGYNKIILIDQVECQCEPCNKSITRANIFDHCNQEKHVKKLRDLIKITNNQTKPNQKKKEADKEQSTEDKTTQNDDVTKMLYHFRAQDIEFLCKTCHALVPRDAASVKGHLESKQHLEKYNILLNSNKIYKTTGSFHCEVCDVQVPMTGEITHVYGTNHINNFTMKAKVKDDSNMTTGKNVPVVGPSAYPIASTSKGPIKTNIETTIPLYIKYQYKDLSETQPICLICEKHVKKSDITNHVLSTTHNLNFNLSMMNNTIKIKDTMYFCVSCNTHVPVFGEIQHIFGKSHLNNMKNRPVASEAAGMLTYDHVLNLPRGKRMVKY